VSWRGRLAVLASRGETNGSRVDECKRALSNHRLRAALVEWGYTQACADALIDGAGEAAQTPGRMP